MTTPLRVLIVEDRPEDAELMLRELRRTGFEPTAWRVTTGDAFVEHLEHNPDVILADYTLPSFGAPLALDLLRRRRADVPVIVVTGSVDEETAVECMRRGAADYLLKDRLSRLGPAVRRALGGRQAREEKRQAVSALEASEERYRIVSELTTDFAYALRILPDQTVVCEWVTGAFCRVTGFTAEEASAPGFWPSIVHPADQDVARLHWRSLLVGQPHEAEYRIQTRSGEPRVVRDYGRPTTEGRPPRVARVYGAARDVTETRRADRVRRLLGAAVQHASEAMVITTSDLEAPGPKILFVNPTFTELTGYEADEAIGQSPRILQGPKTERATMKRLKLTLARGDVFHGEAINYRKDGSEYLSEWDIAPIRDEENRVTHYISMQRDVTAKRAMERALRASEERYALAAQGSNDGLWDWDVQRQGLYLSPRAKVIVGFREDETVADPSSWFGRVHPEDAPRFRAALKAHMRGKSEHFECETRMLDPEGGIRWVLTRGLAVRNTSGIPLRMAGSLTDVSERRQVEEQLRRDALHDALTGLPNRAVLDDRLALAFRRSERRRGLLFGVLFVDLEGVATVNEQLGRAVGDALLVTVARRIEMHARAGDTVARIGGAQFAILLDELKHETDAGTVADRIQADLKKPTNVQGHALYVGANLGIALSTGGAERAEDLLRAATVAAYQAKEQGQAREEVFDRDSNKPALAVLQLERELQKAIERKEFELQYQPIVAEATGAVVALEALVRWRHPTRGLLGPGEFLPFAEECGVTVQLGEQILEMAAAQLDRWEAMRLPRVRIAMNLTARQWKHKDLRIRLARFLRTHHVDAARLQVEIAENLVMENPDDALELLEGLAKLGVRIAVDDFGTGASSLHSLARFPLSTLKIHRSFIQNLVPTDGAEGEAKVAADPASAAVVKAAVALAHSLGIEVVAVGVETVEQRAALKELGCDALQGYLFGAPLPADDATRILVTMREAEKRKRSLRNLFGFAVGG